MDFTEGDWNDIQEDQLNYWLIKPSIPLKLYYEPRLEEFTVEMTKIVCDVLHQTDEVFITAVDVLEEYVNAKSLQNYEIPNSLLSVTCAILITSKLIGSHPEIKIQTIQTIIMKLTKTEIHRDAIKQVELDIFLTLGKLPLTTTATDLILFLEYYIKNLKLRLNSRIEALCLEILNVIYICRKKLFFQLKSYYMQSEHTMQAFKHLVCNKMYFPGGIILCALRVTKLKRFLDLKQVSQDIEKISSIHYDHLQLLAGTIFDILETSD